MTDIPPIILSAVVCDRVLFDAPTKTSSLISIRDTIVSPKYPLRYPQLFFFAELTNGHNDTPISVRLIDTSQDDKILIEKTANLKFPDVKNIVSVAMGFEGLIFEHPGQYCFQILCGKEQLASRRLICLLLKQPPKNNAQKN